MANGKEIICLNIGQAGVQISNSCWELFCIEHGLDCQGYARSIYPDPDDPFVSNLSTFFYNTKKGNFVPRSINVDLEPSVIDEIRLGPYRYLWNPNCLINGLEDASNNFGRGYISIGKKIIDEFMTALSRLIQECDKLHGLIILHSYSGGTGSGFTNLILDYLRDEYTKITNIASIVFPSPGQQSAVVEPYNCILAAAMSLHNIDVALLTDNECLYKLCTKNLMIQHPTYQNVNRLLSQLFSSLTVTLRFGSSLDHDIVHLQTNLIPFPRLHFPISTFAPLSDSAKSEHDIISTNEITHDLFDQDNRFISCNAFEGKYMACCLHYRGLVRPSDINTALMEIKRRKDIVFVDWSPVGFKIGISPMPPASVAHSDLAATNMNCSMFFNSTSIETAWNTVHTKFTTLFQKRAFLHWFVGEGMEELEFSSSHEDICRLQKDYRDISTQSDEWFIEEYQASKSQIQSDDGISNSKTTETYTQRSDSVEIEMNNNFIADYTSILLKEAELYAKIDNNASKSLYCIEKINKTSESIKLDDGLSKNRQLFKLFQDSSK